MNYSTKEKQRLKTHYGEWAVITGASSGIGEELTKRIAEAGLKVLIVGRNTVKLNALKTTLETQYSVQVEPLTADVSEDGVHKIIEATQGKNIGLLVASAGFGTSGSFLKTAVHAEVNMLRVNCESLLVLTHHFAQLFSQQRKGGIILLSSLVAFQGVPYAANYAATKAYVQSLAEALHYELKPHNVDVLAAAPGPVNSGFSSRANMEMGNVLKPEDVGIPILKALGRKTTILPGRLTKVLVYALRTVPRWAKIRIMKMVMGGMTKHQVQAVNG